MCFQLVLAGLADVGGHEYAEVPVADSGAKVPVKEAYYKTEKMFSLLRETLTSDEALEGRVDTETFLDVVQTLQQTLQASRRSLPALLAAQCSCKHTRARTRTRPPPAAAPSSPRWRAGKFA